MAPLPPSFATLTDNVSLSSAPSIPTFSPSVHPPSAKSATIRPNNTAIIAGSVGGGVALICLLVCVIILRRRRRKREGQVNGGLRPTHRRGLSESDGGSPLLVQSLKSLNSTDVQDGHGRGSSDATPLMQFEPETGASRDISSRTPQSQQEQSMDTPTSQKTSASGSARIYRDLGNSSETPLSGTALPPKLPYIPRSEPLSIMSELLPATTGNSATTDGSRSLDSTRSRGAEQQFSNVYRGFHGSSHSRTMLPNAPMKPLMENEGSGSSSNDANDQGSDAERWSSVADPGGSHGRPRRLPLPPQPHPYNQRPSAPSRNNSGFGLSVLTSAFRKSISASSLASAITTTEFGYSHGALSNYPSLTSMGTTSGTGSYVTARSDARSDASDNRSGGPSGTTIRLGMVNASRPTNGPQPLSRTSLSTAYPSTPSGANSPPPVLPAHSRSASRLLPRIQTQSHNSSNSNPLLPPDPMTNQDPRVRAHMRFPSAHRIRADPHQQPPMARKQQSTYGIIDVVER